MMLTEQDVDNYWTQHKKLENVTGDCVRSLSDKSYTQRSKGRLHFTGD